MIVGVTGHTHSSVSLSLSLPRGTMGCSVIVGVTGHTHCSVSLFLSLPRGAMGCSVIVGVTGHTHCSVSLSLSLPRGAMSCSVVHDCGSYWSNSLFSESFLVSSSWCHGLFCGL